MKRYTFSDVADSLAPYAACLLGVQTFDWRALAAKSKAAVDTAQRKYEAVAEYMTSGHAVLATVGDYSLVLERPRPVKAPEWQTVEAVLTVPEPVHFTAETGGPCVGHLDDMSKADLMRLAAERGVTLRKSWTKARMVATLRHAERQAA